MKYLSGDVNADIFSSPAKGHFSFYSRTEPLKKIWIFLLWNIHTSSTGETRGHCDKSEETFSFFFLLFNFFLRIRDFGGLCGQRWTPLCLTNWAARSCSRRRRRRWKWAAEITWKSSTGNIQTSSPATRPSETTRRSGTGGAGMWATLLCLTLPVSMCGGGLTGVREAPRGCCWWGIPLFYGYFTRHKLAERERERQWWVCYQGSVIISPPCAQNWSSRLDFLGHSSIKIYFRSIKVHDSAKVSIIKLWLK